LKLPLVTTLPAATEAGRIRIKERKSASNVALLLMTLSTVLYLQSRGLPIKAKVGHWSLAPGVALWIPPDLNFIAASIGDVNPATSIDKEADRVNHLPFALAGIAEGEKPLPAVI